jgi:hypothetical protein
MGVIVMMAHAINMRDFAKTRSQFSMFGDGERDGKSRMKIIRDEMFGDIAMLPLFFQWGIRRCNVDGCTNKPSTIVVGHAPVPYGICEHHFQEANQGDGGRDYTFVWDDFDAFAEEK